MAATSRNVLKAARGVQQLFVGNIPWTISRKELREYFSQFGHVSSSLVVFDKNTGLNKGYGFIQFSTNEGYTKATSTQNHYLEGNQLHVNPAAGNAAAWPTWHKEAPEWKRQQRRRGQQIQKVNLEDVM